MHCEIVTVWGIVLFGQKIVLRRSCILAYTARSSLPLSLLVPHTPSGASFGLVEHILMGLVHVTFGYVCGFRVTLFHVAQNHEC